MSASDLLLDRQGPGSVRPSRAGRHHLVDWKCGTSSRGPLDVRWLYLAHCRRRRRMGSCRALLEQIGERGRTRVRGHMPDLLSLLLALQLLVLRLMLLPGMVMMMGMRTRLVLVLLEQICDILRLSPCGTGANWWQVRLQNGRMLQQHARVHRSGRRCSCEELVQRADEHRARRQSDPRLVASSCFRHDYRLLLNPAFLRR